MRRPNFFIVGAAKSGTTSMLRYLSQHPDISMPQKREPNHFGRDLASHSNRITNRSEYLSIFADCGGEPVIGEKSVWYLYSQVAAEEIKEFNPDSRIMIMLRNPLEMIYSLHHQFLTTGNETVTSFDEAIALIDERNAGRGIPESAYFPEGLIYTRVPLYSEQVARYLRAFGRERVHIIRFEELASESDRVYADAVRFLDVSDQHAPNFAIYNKKMKPRSRRIEWLVEQLDSLGPQWLWEPLLWRLKRYNRVESRRPPMSIQTKLRLQRLFRPDVERLSTLLDRDFTNWCSG
jgi:hypothetical protein